MGKADERGTRVFHSAEIVKTPGGHQYHIGLGPGDLAPTVLLCGDPARARRIAAKLKNRRAEKSNREYVTVTGEWEGVPVSVMATGMGPDNTEIAVVEISQIARPTLIRIGSSGALQPQIPLGSIVISSGACRLENTSTAYVVDGYPAVPHIEPTLALLRAAQALGRKHFYGITATAPGFYGSQARDIPGFPPRNPGLDSELARVGVLNLEMEASTLFTLATIAGLRAACACAIFANRPKNVFIGDDEKDPAEGAVIDVGLEAVRILAEMDRERGDALVWTGR